MKKIYLPQPPQAKSVRPIAKFKASPKFKEN